MSTPENWKDELVIKHSIKDLVSKLKNAEIEEDEDVEVDFKPTASSTIFQINKRISEADAVELYKIICAYLRFSK